MNLVGLILIAALSGVIVAVSLRLRSPASSGWADGDRLSEADWHAPTRASGNHGGARSRDPFGLKGEAAVYNAVKDRSRELRREPA